MARCEVDRDVGGCEEEGGGRREWEERRWWRERGAQG